MWPLIDPSILRLHVVLIYPLVENADMAAMKEKDMQHHGIVKVLEVRTLVKLLCFFLYVLSFFAITLLRLHYPVMGDIGCRRQSQGHGIRDRANCLFSGRFALSVLCILITPHSFMARV
jgi:hypothetical protein